jgi:cytoskeletal protein RodZ
MMNVGRMRVLAVLAGFAVALGVAGCAAPASRATTAISSVPASSQPASSQPASSQPASPAPSSVTVPSSGSASLDAAVEKRLWALAVSAATSDGSTVKAAEAVGSTHARAVAVTMSDGVEGDQAVWVVQVEGVTEFVCDACSVPQGASAPHGRFQVLVVDASTFRTLDFGLDLTKIDLTQLGPVVDLHP